VAALAAIAASAVPAFAGETNPLHQLVGAPDGLVLRGSFRSRSEGIDGQFRPKGPEDDFLQSFRTILFAEYDAGPVRIGGELRDARGYAQDRDSTASVGEINAFEPTQAYIGLDLENVGSKGASGMLSVGRYTMEIGSARLVGRADFANSVNAYTGVLLDWRTAAKDRLVLFWNMPATRLPKDPESLRRDKVEWDRSRGAVQFFGGNFSKANLVSDVCGEVFGYGLTERDSVEQPTRNRHLATYGARLVRSPAAGKVDFDVEVARQTGRTRNSASATDTTDRDVKAYLLHAEIGRKLKGGWTPRVSLHADYASGDDRDPQKVTRFDTLYGAARVDFGPSGLFGAVNRSNLVSGGIRVDLTPSKRLDAFVMYRALWLDRVRDSFASTGIRDQGGLSGRHAGSQVEARVRYWIMPKRFRIEAGGAYLVKGRFLRDAPNVQSTEDSRYGYLDLTVEF
jgi:hypothetical protein